MRNNTGGNVVAIPTRFELVTYCLEGRLDWNAYCFVVLLPSEKFQLPPRSSHWQPVLVGRIWDFAASFLGTGLGGFCGKN